MARSFDRLAKPYRLLERLAFGHDLARARAAFLGELADAERVLILGEGDGRFLATFLQVNPHAQVDCVDESTEMLRLAKRRISRLNIEPRVTFHHTDARSLSYPTQHYDLVVTLFFLDVFTETQLEHLIPELARSLAPGGVWYTADFRAPREPLRRLHSLLWLRLLYGFFNWQTDMAARTLVDPTPYFRACGLEPQKTHYRRLGMLYSQLLQKESAPTST